MGLDISLFTDNYDELSELEQFEEIEDQFQLSRQFCNLMSRKNVIETGTPELEQISKITGCDISFLYALENYTPEWEFEDLAEHEDENTLDSMKKANAEIENNILEVHLKLEKLIAKLNTVENLELQLNKTDYDTIGIKEYFSDFKIDKGDGNMGNNFGQDLRNFLRFVKFAKSNSSNTIFFQYG
jgi:hypothetical protein